MIKYLAALVFLSLVFSRFVWADFQKAQEDFRFQFENYVKVHQEYLVARAKFKQFKTLPSETEAFVALKKVQSLRSQALSAYFSVLQEKLRQTRQISDDQRNSLTSEIVSIQTYLSEFDQRAANSKNVTGAENLSAEFEAKKVGWQNSATKVRGVIFSSNLQDLSARLLQLIENTEKTLKNYQVLPDFELRIEKLQTIKIKNAQAKELASQTANSFFAINPTLNQFEVFRLESDGKQNGESAKKLLKEALTAIIEAARGF